ncbi:MAG: rhodanese-like domain-containing protein [Planctomycetota bacterium]
MTHAVTTLGKGGCLSYLVVSSGEAALIDPHLTILEETRAALAGTEAKLRYVIDTHTHADHLSAAATLITEGAELVMHEKAPSPRVTKRVRHGDALRLGDMAVEILHSPGHTPDALSLRIGGDLFTGDALFIQSTGRTDFPGGSAEAMADTLAMFRSLRGVDTLRPGHDYSGQSQADFSKVLTSNPMLAGSRADVVAKLSASKPPAPAAMPAIIRFNSSGQVGADRELSPEEVAGHVAMGEILVDVRNPDEFANGYVDGARLLPLPELQNRWRELQGQKPILMCQSGMRSERARLQLEGLGFPPLKTLKGGINAWKQANLPVKKTSNVISIERQVRIAAGSLVVLGIALSWMFSPAFLFLSAFVGAGLVFAGITNTCGMAMVLMKMPWNRQNDGKKQAGTCAIDSGSKGGNCSA